MPDGGRRQHPPRATRHSRGESAVEISADETPAQAVDEQVQVDEMEYHEQGGEEEEEEEGEEEEEEEEIEELELEPFPPPGLKEISSLASWTVSTAKPGNGVAALRSPDTSLFWQSDGPQPHLLSIHFFKLVEIVHIRVYLDFESDESYTPTKIQFLAGMSAHDIQDFAEMSFEQPTGWIDVDFSHVGPIEAGDDAEDDDSRKDVDWSRRPVLRAFLVQVRILENHQNGKDTHLRAVQLFARDESQETRVVQKATLKPVTQLPSRGTQAKATVPEVNNIRKAAWMLDPDLR